MPFPLSWLNAFFASYLSFPSQANRLFSVSFEFTAQVALYILGPKGRGERWPPLTALPQKETRFLLESFYGIPSCLLRLTSTRVSEEASPHSRPLNSVLVLAKPSLKHQTSLLIYFPHERLKWISFGLTTYHNPADREGGSRP